MQIMKNTLIVVALAIASSSFAAPTTNGVLGIEATAGNINGPQTSRQIYRRRQNPQPSPQYTAYPQYSPVPQYNPVQYPPAPTPSSTPIAIVLIGEPEYQRAPGSGIDLGGEDANQSFRDGITPLTSFPDAPNSQTNPGSDDPTDYLHPQYIIDNPDSTLPGPKGRVTMRALDIDYLSGPCNSRVTLTNDGLLHLYNSGGAYIGQFTGANGACDQMSRVPCVMRFEAGSLNIGNYARGQFHGPKFSTNSNGVMAVVVDSGDIWIIRENGVAEVKLPMNASSDPCGA